MAEEVSIIASFRQAETGANDAKVVSLASSISASGGTDLSGGLKKGYELATKSFDPNKLNRVVLISDGIANVGITDEKLIGDGAALNDGDGILEVVVRWQTPTGHAKQEMSQKTTLGALLASPPKYLGKAKAIIAYAEALKDPPAAKQNLALAKQLATAANPGGKDPELNEVMGLIDQALTIY